MSRRKYLSFKSPNKMKLIGLTYLVAFFIFAPVRYHTGEAFKMTGEFIQRTTRWHLIMKHSNTVRIIDHMGLFPETRGRARYITVKTYSHAMEIVEEQNNLGNSATIVFW